MGTGMSAFPHMLLHKSAFDGESKLQILNGNYQIPDVPKYSASLTDLVRDMLQSSPDGRPDITQIWFRVNGLLPDGLQKSLPDRPPEMSQQNIDVIGGNNISSHDICDLGCDNQNSYVKIHMEYQMEILANLWSNSVIEMYLYSRTRNLKLSYGLISGTPKPANKYSPMPLRSPPPPPLAGAPLTMSSTPYNQGMGGTTDSLGAFWTTQHAKDSVEEDKAKPKYDEESHPASHLITPRREEKLQSQHVQKKAQARSVNGPGDVPSKDFKINLFHDDSDHNNGRSKPTKPEQKPNFQNKAFNTFVAEFDTNKLSPGSYCIKSAKEEKEELLEAEVEKLKEQLVAANMEKAEMTTKYQKLSAICRSQRQEIQGLKQVLAVRAPSPSRDVTRNQASPGSQPSTTQQMVKIEGTVQELQQGLFNQSSAIPDPQPWKAFIDDPKPRNSTDTTPKSVRTRKGNQNREAIELNSGVNTRGFGTDNFKAAPATSPQINLSVGELNYSQRFSESKSGEGKLAPQPAGWAGF